MDELNVTAEIRRLIEDKIEAGVAVRAEWVVRGILERKDRIEGEDLPFYRDCTQRDLIRLAKRVIGKYEVSDTTPEQLVLPGFKHLCKAYSVERDGAPTLVPVDLCTAAELEARAAQYDDMATGCLAHAAEIREYLLARHEAA